LPLSEAPILPIMCREEVQETTVLSPEKRNGRPVNASPGRASFSTVQTNKNTFYVIGGEFLVTPEKDFPDRGESERESVELGDRRFQKVRNRSVRSEEEHRVFPGGGALNIRKIWERVWKAKSRNTTRRLRAEKVLPHRGGGRRSD